MSSGKRRATYGPEGEASPKRRLVAASPQDEKEEGELDDNAPPTSEHPTNGLQKLTGSSLPPAASTSNGSAKPKVAFPFKMKAKLPAAAAADLDSPDAFANMAASSSSRRNTGASHGRRPNDVRERETYPERRRSPSRPRRSRSRSRSRSSTGSAQRPSSPHRLPQNPMHASTSWEPDDRGNDEGRHWKSRDGYEEGRRARNDRHGDRWHSTSDRRRRSGGGRNDAHSVVNNFSPRRSHVDTYRPPHDAYYDYHEPRDSHHHHHNRPRSPHHERARYPVNHDSYRPSHHDQRRDPPPYRLVSPPPQHSYSRDGARSRSRSPKLVPRSPPHKTPQPPPPPTASANELPPPPPGNPPPMPPTDHSVDRKSGISIALPSTKRPSDNAPVPLDVQMENSKAQHLPTRPVAAAMLSQPPPPINTPPPPPPPTSHPPPPSAPNAHPSPASMHIPKPEDHAPRGRPAQGGWQPPKVPSLRVDHRRPKAPRRTDKEEFEAYGRSFSGCGHQDHYDVTTKLGEGTFGEVHKAIQKATKRVVALKRIMMHNEKEGMPVTALREIKILKSLKHHAIIDLVDMFIVRNKDKEPFSVYMVFPYMDHDLAGLLENDRLKLQSSHIKLYMKQLLEGTHYMHQNHILHRDMKAANLLIANDGRLKIADFGLARAFTPSTTAAVIDSRTGATRERKYTNCVVTRWYRPPELLLGARQYGGEVDMWGVGCVFGEMFHRKPILPGSSDPDQLDKIWQMCGTPNQQDWPHHELLPGFNDQRPKEPHVRKMNIFFGDNPQIDEEAYNLLDKMLVCNPKNRITAGDALLHDYFWTTPLPADFGTLPIYEASHELDKRNRGGPPPGFRPPMVPGPSGPPHGSRPPSRLPNNRFLPPPPLLAARQREHQQMNSAGAPAFNPSAQGRPGPGPGHPPGMAHMNGPAHFGVGAGQPPPGYNMPPGGGGSSTFNPSMQGQYHQAGRGFPPGLGPGAPFPMPVPVTNGSVMLAGPPRGFQQPPLPPHLVMQHGVPSGFGGQPPPGHMNQMPPPHAHGGPPGNQRRPGAGGRNHSYIINNSNNGNHSHDKGGPHDTQRSGSSFDHKAVGLPAKPPG